MGADDDLRINTLHRFAKNSPRLTLREYSHCEVPAGCGGVVLRWTDPAEGLAVFVHVESPNANVELWLDGTEVVASTQTLGTRPHLLALHVTRHERHPTGRLLAVPRISIEPRSANLVPRDVIARTSVRNRPDFMRADLDDSRWPLAERAAPRDFVGLGKWRQERFQEYLEGGDFIVVSDDELWARLRFHLDGTAR